MPKFLRLHLVSAYLKFDCRFTHIKPSVRSKGVDLRPNQVKRASKISPIGPRWKIQGTNRCPRWHTKRRVREARNYGGQRPPQPDCGAHHDLTMVAATVSSSWLPQPRQLSFPRALCFLRGLFVFSRNFSLVFAAILPPKGDELGCKRG